MSRWAGTSIVLALDKPVHRTVLEQVLSPEGYDIALADSEAQLLEYSQRNPPELVLIDSELPAHGGLNACRALRGIPSLAEIPVLILSARGVAVDAFHAGAEDVVEWPIRPDILLARVETHAMLHHARLRLAEKNRESEHLLHVLSHDLWNPIAAMRGFVGLAKRADPEGKFRALCENLETCLSHQENIIERVRELRAQDSGKRLSIIAPVRLEEALSSAVDLMHGRYTDKQVALDVAYGEGTQGMEVWADPVGLVHGGICNLLSNALKFSMPGGRVTIHVSQDGDACTLEFRDEGVGIPRTLLPRLFKLDYATSRAGTAGERGTGFGLPLVKRVIDRCGGSITLESRDIEEFPDDHGTTARVTLRRVRAQDRPS